MLKRILMGAGMAYLARKFMGGRRTGAYNNGGLGGFGGRGFGRRGW